MSKPDTDTHNWVHPTSIPRRYYRPTAGHPPAGVHVPVRTNWEDRQPIPTLDEVFDAVL